MTNTKTHYRKVFKSDHLGIADLEDFNEAGSNLIFTIDCVRQERGAKVAGKKIDANIAYFKENIKPLVLNATNSKVMRKLTDSCFVEDWGGVMIQLYIDHGAKLKGEIVGGVRINPRAPQPAKALITPENEKMWNNAKAAYKRDGNFNAVFERADISQENQALIIQECSENV